MRKTWYLAVQGIILAVLGIIVLSQSITDHQILNCNNEVVDLHYEEAKFLMEKQEGLNWIHYLHTLRIAELVENNTFYASKYKNSTWEEWDKIAILEKEIRNMSSGIKDEVKECNSLGFRSTLLNKISFVFYIILISVTLIIFHKTKK